MFNVLGEKITIQKMRNIISDFDEKLKKKKDEMDMKIAEEKKLEKKPKVNKKPTVAGANKGGANINAMLFNDIDDEDAEGEDDGEGDGYVNYERDPYDFM